MQNAPTEERKIQNMDPNSESTTKLLIQKQNTTTAKANFQYFQQFRLKYHALKEEEANNAYLKRPVEFRALYWIVWVQLLIVTLLYWLMGFNFDYFKFDQDENKDDQMQKLMFVLLRLVPSILNILTYVLIYFQMQNLFIISRIHQRQHGINQKQIMYIIKVVIYVFTGLVVVTEFLLLVFVIFKWMNSDIF